MLSCSEFAGEHYQFNRSEASVVDVSGASLAASQTTVVAAVVVLIASWQPWPAVPLPLTTLQTHQTTPHPPLQPHYHCQATALVMGLHGDDCAVFASSADDAHAAVLEVSP